MKIEPVKDISAPKYPDKYAKEVQHILASAHPQRWKTKSLVVGALAATVAIGLSDYNYGAEGAPVISPEQAAIRDDMSTTNPSAATTSPPIGVILGENVALPTGVIPLFEYGKGIGSFGCVSVSAPYFMSEDEAFAILKAAFAEADMELSKDKKEHQVIRPVTTINTIGGLGINEPNKITSNLTLDGLANGMPVKFVSRVDVEKWKRPTGPKTITMSVSSYKMKGAAQTLAENNPGLVVFYDPVSYVDPVNIRIERKNDESDEDFRARYLATRTLAQNEARTESEQQLRNQVRAFIEWLNAEGMR